MLGRTEMTRAEVKAEIIRFLDGGGGPWDWDDFTSVALTDPFLDSIRRVCLTARSGFPQAAGERAYCNDGGVRLLRAIADAL